MRRISVLIVIFSSILSCENKPREGVTDPGQLLYLGYTKKDVNCVRCHGPEGVGGMDAPDIRNVFNKYDENEILDIIEYGKGEGSNAMPPYEKKLNERELHILLGFLQTLSTSSNQDSLISN